MTTDELLRALSEADPCRDHSGVEDRGRDDRILHRVVRTPVPERRRRRWRGALAPVAAVAVTIVVVLVVVRVAVDHGARAPADDAGRGASVVLRVQPRLGAPRVTPDVLAREVAGLRGQFAQAGLGVTVARGSGGTIVITGSGARAASRAAVLWVADHANALRFVDWEASVVRAGGETVATGLARQDPVARTISQGRQDGAGGADSGAMPLYAAVRLAAGQRPSDRSAFSAPSFYLFGDRDDPACAGQSPGEPCYLAGPVSSRAAARAQRPPSVAAAATRVLRVPTGTTVVQAVGQTTGPTGRAARFWVLRDGAAIPGPTAIRAPVRASEIDGSWGVGFRWTATGRRELQAVTRTIAHRGANESLGADRLYQHLAAVAGGRLVSVAQINYNEFPDGLIADHGSGTVLTGSSRSAARGLAAAIDHRAPAVTLTPVWEP